MIMFNKTIQAVAKELNTNLETGLTEAEAKRRLGIYGENRLERKGTTPIWKLFFEQMNSLLIYILIVAAVISAFVGEVADAIIIFLVVILNAAIGVVQGAKAEKAIEELQKLATPTALVRRDCTVKEIPSEQIVPGDVVLLHAGNMVPADIRLTKTTNLHIEEAALTGESVPVTKKANVLCKEKTPLAEQINMGFMSTIVTYGRGEGIVVKTGKNTEIGSIANMLVSKEKQLTPLQKKLDELGKILGFAAIFVCVIIFFIGFYQGRNPLEIFLIAVSLAVAAIPEGLMAIVTVVLAIGVQRMIKQNAIVRKLPAVETLGSVSVICSDKTGTLTENKMTVTNIYVNGEETLFQDINTNNFVVKQLLESMVLCNDAEVNEVEETGDPTEIALLRAAKKKGFIKRTLANEYERIDEIPFDSDRKMMTTVHKKNDTHFSVTKGALERVLQKCRYVQREKGIFPLTKDEKEKIVNAATQMSDRALRVLAFAKKEWQREGNKKKEELEENLVFLGFIGMIDSPREEVKGSILSCKTAGITTIMITGDHQNTALAIAKDLGIAEDVKESMTGSELDELSEMELMERVKHTRVFARVSPEHKVRIVKAIKENGFVVAMTGDGVNDAPSLKQADVGVAMGMTGTDVTKGAADIVLTDDNFSTIVKAVEQGRNIFENIKKALLFLLSCNLGEITALFFGILLGLPAPLTAVQILWVNLITDTFPAIALGLDPEDPDVMKRKPRDPKETFLDRGRGRYVLWNGILIGLITLFVFMEGLRFYSGADSIFSIPYKYLTNEVITHAQTMAFITLSFSQLVHSINLRSKDKSIFQIGLFTNKYLIGAMLLGVILQTLLVYVPFFREVFHIYPLSFKDWMLIIGITFTPLIANELVKRGKRAF